MSHHDHQHLTTAAKLALRGHGGAEPNPLVGCVIVSGPGEVVGWGYHRRCGGDHAEVWALRRAGRRAAGATVYVTLEPCNHAGRTGPCTEALISAGVGRVVFARADPTPAASGGAARLRAAGIETSQVPDCAAAIAVSEPYVHRVTTGLPWVVAKWAQTIDGSLTTPDGEGPWISSPASRRLVHLERGRVDAILTGIGTVRADDPLLTARGRRRRVPRRVVVDPRLEISTGSKLVRTAADVPTTVACRDDCIDGPRAAALRAARVELIGLPGPADELPLVALLRELVTRHETANVLVEAGPGLLGRLFAQGLIDEAWVFVAPRGMRAMLGMGRPEAPPAGAAELSLLGVRRRGDDVILRYGVSPKSAGASGS